MNLLNRVIKGKKTLRKILEAQNLITEKTKITVGFFTDELRASNILFKKTRSELLGLILPLINDYLKEDYNDIKIENGKITIRRRNFLKIRGEALTTGDFINAPKIFDIHKINAETNGFFMAATTGIGKTEVAKIMLRRLLKLEPIIFSTTPDEYRKEWLLIKDKNIYHYNREGMEFLKNYFKTWLENEEFRNNDKSLIVLDEAFVLFSQKSKEVKELAEMVNQFLAFNRKSSSRILILGQSALKEAFQDLNFSLVGTKIINVEDIANFKSFGAIPEEIKAQKLGRGEFYLFHAGNKAQILKYTQERPPEG